MSAKPAEQRRPDAILSIDGITYKLMTTTQTNIAADGTRRVCHYGTFILPISGAPIVARTPFFDKHKALANASANALRYHHNTHKSKESA